MGPTSRILIVGVVLLAVALFVVVARAGRLWVRLLAGSVAFLMSFAAGVLTVNDFYGYYTSWGSAYADLTGSGNSYAASSANAQLRGTTSSHSATPATVGQVRTIRLAGQRSGITRSGLIYLPPQYFQPAYRNVRFPVLELLHGTPGDPAQWVDQKRGPQTAGQMIQAHLIGPMVLVMPDSNAGWSGAQECLNTPAFKDDTYISQDVPTDVMAHFRVSRDRSQWGLLGTSSGGYCAANLMMRHRSDYGAVGAINGYYRPQDGVAQQLIGAHSALAHSNDPLAAATSLHSGAGPLPPFWIASDTGSPSDYRYAKQMVAAMRRLEQVPFVIMPGAKHTESAIRAAVPDAFRWSWQQLSTPAQRLMFPTLGAAQDTYLHGTPTVFQPHR